MTNSSVVRRSLPGQIAAIVLASAIGIPVWAQSSADSTSQATSSQSAQPSSTDSQNYKPAAPYVPPAKEGFWGRVNPLARKKWVKKQIDPINNRLSELDEVNAKNARDISDVDSRAQAGISKAQQAADAANQTATAASTQAQNANQIASTASGRVDTLHTTVNGIDTYKPINEIDVPFKRGSTVLSKDAQAQLDQLAGSLKDHKGYIVEIEGHSPGRGVAGVETSERLTQAVRRYLVEHDVPVYRVHALALGNVQAANNAGEEAKPLKTSSVHIRLMENSLAARDAASPQGAASTTGAERP